MLTSDLGAFQNGSHDGEPGRLTAICATEQERQLSRNLFGRMNDRDWGAKRTRHCPFKRP